MLKCNVCNKNIVEKKDANFIAFLGIIPKPFCNNCYSSSERGIGRHFLYIPSYPINSGMYIVSLVILLVGFFLSLFVFLSGSVEGDVGTILVILACVGLWELILYFTVHSKIYKLK